MGWGSLGGFGWLGLLEGQVGVGRGHSSQCFYYMYVGNSFLLMNAIVYCVSDPADILSSIQADLKKGLKLRNKEIQQNAYSKLQVN